MKTIATLVLLLIASTGLTQAQFSRYIVQFTDKKGTPYTLSNPSAYLSAKAIARRTSQKLTVDSTDLPVNPAYVETIRNIANVAIINTSKWLNQVCIKTTDANALAAINALPFVKKTNVIAPRVGRNTLATKVADENSGLPVSVKQTREQTGVTAFDYGQTFNQIHIHNGDLLHRLGFSGRGMTIAVLDAGFRNYLINPAFDSVRLQGRVLGTWDYVNNEASVNEDNSHGAFVFSLLASNQPGVMVGTAPHASYYLLRTEDAATEYPIEEQHWAVAAEFADSVGVYMISTSLGYAYFHNSIFNYSYAQRIVKTAMVTIAANLAAKKGILVVVAAGNSGAESGDGKFVSVPADAENVLTVGSVDKDRNIAASSSWGPNGASQLKPNVVSLGENAVVANHENGNPIKGSGTSFACPNLAGLVACLWQGYPELTNMQVMDVVQQSADRAANPDFRFGYGIPDFKKAVVQLTKEYATSNSSFSNCIVTINWKSKDDTSTVYSIQKRMPGETGYITIGEVASSSVSFKANSYMFNDTIRVAANNAIQYRIVQNMRSADTTFEIASLQQTLNSVCFPDNTLLALPSPFDNELNIIVNVPEAIANMGIQITNMMGQVMYAMKTNKPAGFYRTPVYTGNWQPGIYEITVYDNSKKVYKRKVLKM